MSHFSAPLNVKAVPELNAVRISVRASETRIDEWTISATDVESVLTAPETADWRGSGEVRVQLSTLGGSVAFHSPGGDRAIIRGPESMVNSFVAHLQAAYAALPPSDITVSRYQSASAMKVPASAALVPVETVSGTAPPTSGAVPAPVDLSAHAAQLAALFEQSTAILENLTLLSQIVQKLVARPSVAPAPVPTVSTGSAVLQEPEFTPTADQVFIPSISTSLSGNGLGADEKSGAGGDLTAASTALRAAKKKKTTL
jgi:hypothetical protein